MKESLYFFEEFLNNRTSFDEFFRLISEYYGSDNSGWKNLPESAQEFVYDVYEKATYTAEGLSKDDPDRRHGVVDENDFRFGSRKLSRNIMIHGIHW